MTNASKLILLVFALHTILLSCSESKKESFIRNQLFNSEWKFIRDSVLGAEQVGFDDSNWQVVNLPHDFSLMDLPGEDTDNQIGPFSKESPGNGNSTGHFIGGTGWYRKSFTLDKCAKNKTVILNFDGVYMETEIWVNGKHVGSNKNGYTPFSFDITNKLFAPGKENVIAVKVDNIGRNSRWYSGSGIYRNVRLSVLEKLHVSSNGVYITTPEISTNAATASIEVTVQNDLDKSQDAQVSINIIDPDNKIITTSTKTLQVQAKKEGLLNAAIEIENPTLWSPENPNLYTAEIIIEADNKVTDRYKQKFGIRSIEFSAEKGLLLNGKSVLLKGGCVHHDNGLLGAAAFKQAEIRKVKLLKENGFNAIRFSHNPPSKVFLEACDSLGMLVINEFTDMWEKYKNPQDYSVHFSEYWEKDVTNWMLRDRNHPSVIMWSIGNEIYEPDADTRLRIATQLTNRVKELDNTRGVTLAITGFFYPKGWETTAPIFDLMDVCGYNYMIDKIESDHEKYPERIIYLSESYANSAFDYWKAVEKYPYVIGDFIWTAWDYLGEVSIGSPSYVPEGQGPGFSGNFSNFTLPEGINIFDIQARRASNWPNYLANCGDIDITGEKTPQMLYRDIIWGNSNIEINVHEPIPQGMQEAATAWAWPAEFPHWNWQGNEDKKLQVRVFTREPEVQLELNDKVVGKKKLTEADKYIAVFEVPYQPGELKATTLKDGKTIETKSLKTTGSPKSIRIITEQNTIHLSNNDLAFIKIELVDENGVVVPDATNTIQLSIEGEGKIIASGNASTNDMRSFNQTTLQTFKGKAQVIVRPFSNARLFTLRAKSEGLNEAATTFTTN